jgi:type IV pilus assembly protein PilE
MAATADNPPMKCCVVRQRTRAGFSLIELMVVVAIAAIIAAVAIPSYQSAMQRSRRADAMAALGEIAQAQERWRANNASYQDTLANLPGARSMSHDGHYDLTLVDGSVTASSYTARATARETSPQAADTACATIDLAMVGNNGLGNIVYSPNTCWVR